MPYPTFIYHLIFFVAIMLALYSFDFRKENIKKFAFIFVIFLIIIGGLRGDFTSDYRNYFRIYESIERKKNLIGEVIGYYPLESGYLLLNYTLSRFFSTPIPLFLVCMSIILIPIWNLSAKCLNPFLFFLLYLSFGMMYDSYNVMRSMMAASLFLFTFEWLKKGALVRYLIFVLLLLTIHKTSFLMIPFYFLLRRDFFEKKNILVVLLSFLFFIFIGEIYTYFDTLMYGGTSRDIGRIGISSVNSIIMPLFFIFSVFVLYLFKDENALNEYCTKNKMEINIVLNSSLFCTFFFLSTLVFPIFERFTYFLFPFVIYGFINNIMLRSPRKRAFLVWGTVCFCFLYYFVWGQYYQEFYFFWQKSQL